MAAARVKIPAGEKITISHGKLQVPDHPIIAFIEGDGVGPDIWAASVRVLDAAVAQAYKGRRKIAWAEVYAGEKAATVYGKDCPPNLLPTETLDVIREYLVAIKGPLTTPIGEGFRSLNVSLRQELDLYVCLRPVRWFKGVPSPVKHPEKIDMVIFRENTEDIYAGIEWMTGTPEAKKVVEFLQKEMGVKNIRFPGSSSIGIKPVSKEGSERLIRAAMRYAIENGRRNVTLVHKGNIQKYTEGMFMKWGYALAKREFSDRLVSWDDCGGQAAGGEDPGQGRHHRRVPAADPDPARRVRRDPVLQPDRRPDLRRAGGAGGRHRHRARRQHQLRHRARAVRGHPRHRAQVHGPGQGQPGLGHPLRRDDAALHGLERGGGPDHRGASRRPSGRRS